MDALQWSVVFLIVVLMGSVLVLSCLMLSSRISEEERKRKWRADFDAAWQRYSEGEMD